MLKRLLSGEERLRVHVHKADDIAALLRFVDEFGPQGRPSSTPATSTRRASTTSSRDRGIPVIYGPMDSLAYKVELKHENWRNIKYLIDSGVEFGLMTDHPVILQKMLLFELRHFLRVGMSKADALGVITAKNAELIGRRRHPGDARGRQVGLLGLLERRPLLAGELPVAIYAEGKLIYKA